MDLKEKLENLLKQKEQLEFTTIKIVGAIELIQAMMAEKEKSEEEKSEEETKDE